MKLFISTLFLLLATANTATAQISGEDCVGQGGEVVGDIGDGAIFQPDYVCATTGAPPTDSVAAAEKAIAIEGAVCCGGTGSGIEGEVGLPTGGGFGEETPNNGGTSCTSDADCPVINCFVAPCDDSVCANGFCELQAPEGQDQAFSEGLPTNNTADRTAMTRQECTDNDGAIVGDIGDGAIHRPGYVCDSNGQAPIGTVVPAEGEPIAREGEVCCGPAGTAEATTFDEPNTETETPAVTDEEEEKSGAISASKAPFAAVGTVVAVLIY